MPRFAVYAILPSDPPRSTGLVDVDGTALRLFSALSKRALKHGGWVNVYSVHPMRHLGYDMVGRTTVSPDHDFQAKLAVAPRWDRCDNPRPLMRPNLQAKLPLETGTWDDVR